MRRLVRIVSGATGILAALLSAAALACDGRNVLADRPATYLAKLDAAANKVPYPEGRYFEVQRGGAKSVLFGTMHLPDPEVARVPPALLPRLLGARMVFVEITADAEAHARRMFLGRPSLLRNENGRRISDMASEAEMAALDDVLDPHGLERAVFDRLEPWFLNLLAAVPPCGGAETVVLDRRIEHLARAGGVPVQGLEAPEDVLFALKAGTYEEQLETLLMGLPMVESAADSLAVTRKLYLEGDIFKIWVFGQMEAERVHEEAAEAVFARTYEHLVTERNERWMERLLPALREGGAVVAVGALHLGGPSGLLPMLEAEGFEVRPLPE
ncbi:MAG: TraB/GumN family protein [Pseudomonadota bacterium]